MTLKLTQQQEDILKSFSSGKNMKINAFAGTGKTTMLKTIVEKNPNKKFLVLVFNNSVKEELKKKFPNNADVYTIHSFAYNKIKNRLPHSEFNVVDEKRIPVKITEIFGIPYIRSQILVSVVEKYCNSDIIALSGRSIKQLVESDEVLEEYFKKNKSFLYDDVAEKIRKIFELMIRGKIPFTHGGYLKYFQILIDQYISRIRYDVVMLDEGQDTNPVSLFVFKKLYGQKIIVGDTHQSIYGRRGAINAMESVDYENYYITKSFRINQNTASKGSLILQNYGLESKPLEAYFEEGGNENGLTCHIFRTNAGIVNYIFDKLNEGVTSFSFRGTRKLDEIFRTALDLEKVYNYFKDNHNEKIIKNVQDRISFIARMFDDRKSFYNFILNDIDDYELSSNLALINSIHKRIDCGSDDLIADLRKREDNNNINIAGSYSVRYLYEKAQGMYSESANNVLSTAHSVKGLEYDDVYIEDDFPSIYESLCKKLIKNKKWSTSICNDKNYYYKINHTIDTLVSQFFDKEKRFQSPQMRSIIEEINLMYVAITRSIKSLNIGSRAVLEILDVSKEDFKKHLIYTLIKVSPRELSLSSNLLSSIISNNYFFMCGKSFTIGNIYLADELIVLKNGKKRRRILKNDKWLVVIYKSKFREYEMKDLLDVSINNAGNIYESKLFLSSEEGFAFANDKLKEGESICANIFDIPTDVLGKGELIIRDVHKDGIILDLANFSVITEKSLEI